MLLIGLPGAIALGCGLALVMFDVLTVFEAAILGTMLAATDAALGKAVVTNKAVPARIREGLNVESGLNDGLCVPVLFAFIAMAIGADAETEGAGLTFHLIVEELGIGLLVGPGYDGSRRLDTAQILGKGLGHESLDTALGRSPGAGLFRNRAESPWKRLYRSIYRGVVVRIRGKGIHP